MEPKDYQANGQQPGFFQQIYERLTQSLSVMCGCCARNTSTTKYVVNSNEHKLEQEDETKQAPPGRERGELMIGERNYSLDSMAEENDCEDTIARRRQSLKNMQPWTKKEDELLLSLYEKYNGKQWREIAKCFPGRSAPVCRMRMKKINPLNKRNPWEIEEDRRLYELVAIYGNDWATISSKMPGRSRKQVRERFLNALNPSINREKWTKEEDELILTTYHQIGSKWSEISKVLKNRPENMVKNRFYSHIKRKMMKGDESDDPRFSSSYSEMDLISSCSSTTINNDPWLQKLGLKQGESRQEPKFPVKGRQALHSEGSQTRVTDIGEENWGEMSFEADYPRLYNGQEMEIEYEGFFENQFEAPENGFNENLMPMEPEKLLKMEENVHYGVPESLIAIDFALREIDEKIKEAQYLLKVQILTGSNFSLTESQATIENLTLQKRQLQDKKRRIYPQW